MAAIMPTSCRVWCPAAASPNEKTLRRAYRPRSASTAGRSSRDHPVPARPVTQSASATSPVAHVGTAVVGASAPGVPALTLRTLQHFAPITLTQPSPSLKPAEPALPELARRRAAARGRPWIPRARSSLPSIRERDAPGSGDRRPSRFVAIPRVKVCRPRRSSAASRRSFVSCCNRP